MSDNDEVGAVNKRLEALEARFERVAEALEALALAQNARRANPGPESPGALRDLREDNRELLRMLLERTQAPPAGGGTLEALRVLHEMSKPNPVVETIEALADSIPTALNGAADSVGEAVKLMEGWQKLKALRRGGA
jgi:hypothetical protein